MAFIPYFFLNCLPHSPLTLYNLAAPFNEPLDSVIPFSRSTCLVYIYIREAESSKLISSMAVFHANFETSLLRTCSYSRYSRVELVSETDIRKWNRSQTMVSSVSSHPFLNAFYEINIFNRHLYYLYRLWFHQFWMIRMKDKYIILYFYLPIQCILLLYSFIHSWTSFYFLFVSWTLICSQRFSGSELELFPLLSTENKFILLSLVNYQCTWFVHEGDKG